MRATGLEPARPCGHKNLNLVRLPISPRPPACLQGHRCTAAAGCGQRTERNLCGGATGERVVGCCHNQGMGKQRATRQRAVWVPLRRVIGACVLGALTVVLSVLVMAIWPQAVSDGAAAYARKRAGGAVSESAEGTGSLHLYVGKLACWSYGRGVATQPRLSGGYYDLPSSTEPLADLGWPRWMAELSAPWLPEYGASEPWPADFAMHSRTVCSAGWPFRCVYGVVDLRMWLEEPAEGSSTTDPSIEFSKLRRSEVQMGLIQLPPAWSNNEGWLYRQLPVSLTSSEWYRWLLAGRHDFAMLPYRPLWPGLLGNWTLASAVWLGVLLWAGPVWHWGSRKMRRVARRAWARVRGRTWEPEVARCARCGYALTGLAAEARCPECDATLRTADDAT